LFGGEKLNRKKPAICIVLVAILLSSIFLIRPIAAEESGYQSITVHDAKQIIEHMPNTVIIDVRNQSEYDLGPPL
jgi:hypothetical protein